MVVKWNRIFIIFTCDPSEGNEGRADVAEWRRAARVHLVDGVTALCGDGVGAGSVVEFILQPPVNGPHVRRGHEVKPFLDTSV